LFWIWCGCSGYGVGFVEKDRVFLERVCFFWIRIGCSAVRKGVVE